MKGLASADIEGYGKIVVPLDGSEFAEAVLPTAAAIAGMTRSTVCLVLVHIPLAGEAEVGFAPKSNWEEEVRRGETEYLARIARRVSGDDGPPTETRMLDGPVGTGIANYVSEIGAKLLVIATHGRSGLSRAWHGSIADWLMRYAPVPVLLVRPTASDATADAVSQLPHILVPLDGSAIAEAVLPEAMRLGHLHGARCTLLRVVPPAVYSLPYGYPAVAVVHDEEIDKAQLKRAREYLDGVAARLQREHSTPDIVTETIVEANVANAVLERVRATSVDLIAMTTRGRGASRLLVGSVADKIMRGFGGPMLLLGPVATGGIEAETSSAEELAGAGTH